MTESERIDHDRLFKELISTFSDDFLAQFLSDLAVRLRPQTLSFTGTELFTDVTSGQKYTADLVAIAQLEDTADEFVLHIEHQSGSKSNFPRRMWLYFSRLHEKYNLPICQVAVLAFDEPQRADPDYYEVRFLDNTVLRLQYRTIQLNRLDWQDFINRDSPIVCAFMSKMRMRSQDRPRVKLECLLMLVRLQLDEARSQLLSGFIDTYLRLNAEEEAIFQAELAQVLPQNQEGVMEIVTSWMERGIEQGIERGIERGIEQGIERGRQQEAIALNLRLLSRLLGTVSPQQEEAIRNLSLTQLEALSEALLDFTTSADLDTWLRQIGD